MGALSYFREFQEWRQMKGMQQFHNANAATPQEDASTQSPRKAYTAEEEAIHKADHEKYVAHVKVDDLDGHGEKIVRIYASAEDFVIYETEGANPSLEVKVCIQPRDINDNKFFIRYDKIRLYYTTAKSLLYKVENTANARARIGGIMAHALSKDANVQPAIDAFNELIREIHSEFNDRVYNKLTFLFSNIGISVVLAGFSIWQYYNLSHSKSYHRYNLDIFTLLPCILACSVIGGTFSLSVKLRNLTMLRSVRRRTYVLYGLERSFISMAAGTIMYFAVSAKLIFTALLSGNDDKQNLFTIFFLAVLAGFSETLVPDLLVTLEKKKEGQEQAG
jgi:hypothetical protein